LTFYGGPVAEFPKAAIVSRALRLDGDIDSTSRKNHTIILYHQENQQHHWHCDSCWNLALANNGADD
jgi:7-cyano-7-deazaguanine synthase in queuosine biosynthesis